MERFKKLRNIVTLLVLIFVVNLIFLILLIPSFKPLTVIVLAVQAIVILYFAVLARQLIKENEDMERKDDERRTREKNESKPK